MILFIKSVKHIPNAEHIHNAERAVIESVSGTYVTGSLVPKVSAVVGTDITLESAVVVCLEDLKNTRITVAVAMACLGEVSVFKMLYVSDMSISFRRLACV